MLALAIVFCSCSLFANDTSSGEKDSSTQKQPAQEATNGSSSGEQVKPPQQNGNGEADGDDKGDAENPDEQPDTPVDPESCEHQFGEWKTVRELGCFGIEGIRERECTLCKTVERETTTVEGHANIVKDPAREATCTEEGLTEGMHCEACSEVLLAQTVIPLRSHRYDGDDDAECNVCGYIRDLNCEHANLSTIAAKEPTCIEAGYTEGKKCEDCGEIIVEPQMISAHGHSEQTVAGYPPTETEQGLTDGAVCTVCHEVVVPQRPIMPIGYSNIERYASTYGYDTLAELENGEKLQELYMLIDEAATLFHTDTTIDATPEEDTFVVSSIKFSELGLREEDAMVVWTTYRNDHPLYYWINARFTYNSEKLNLLTSEEYAKGEARETYNKIVFDGAREYISLVNNESSPYRIALGLHDAIIENISYAFAEDGVSPETALWAHNVLGVFERKSGVCESYAKTFQLLLNYCGVENIYVTGESMNEDHAWNMVKMDDGEWYWFDLTWDDTPEWMFGVSYNYFCSTDAQDVSQIDGPWKAEPQIFSDTHFHSIPEVYDVDYLYPLPDRAEEEIDVQVAMLRDTFTVDGLKYAVIGFGKVQLVGILEGADVEIPESVGFEGYDYDVVSIGGMSGSLLKTEPLETLGEAISSVYIPASVGLIWDRALLLDGIESIEVAEDSQVYESLDGVLFTKGLYTLIQYPIGSARAEYVIPESVREVANYSFGDGSAGKLERLAIGKDIELLGTMNAGYGYRAEDGDRLYLAEGDIFYIRALMNFEGEIIIDAANDSFMQTESAVYSADGSTLYYLKDSALTEFECDDTLEIIGAGAFFGCRRLQTLTLGGSVKEIGSFAFGYCSSLKTVVLKASEGYWDEIEKQPNWDTYAPSFYLLYS